MRENYLIIFIVITSVLAFLLVSFSRFISFKLSRNLLELLIILSAFVLLTINQLYILSIPTALLALLVVLTPPKHVFITGFLIAVVSLLLLQIVGEESNSMLPSALVMGLITCSIFYLKS